MAEPRVPSSSPASASSRASVKEPDAHWQRLMDGRPSAETARFAPYVVHPVAPIEFDKQIPKKGDQRQMEPWQRIGTYAAGLALDRAGLKGNPSCSRAPT